MEAMMDAIEEILPVGSDEWEQVAEIHATSYPELQRDGSSLRRKFAALYNTKMPTGDPKCPSHVRRAKRANIRIEARYDSTNLQNGSVAAADLGFDEFNDEEEEDEEGKEHEARVLFTQGSTQRVSGRPLVTPRSARSGGGISDITQVLMTSMVQRMEREDSEREERRQRMEREDNEREERRQRMDQQQQMNMAMMFAMISAVNPAAAENLRNMTSQPVVGAHRHNHTNRSEEQEESE
jgi:hypothetical protein